MGKGHSWFFKVSGRSAFSTQQLKNKHLPLSVAQEFPGNCIDVDINEYYISTRKFSTDHSVEKYY